MSPATIIVGISLACEQAHLFEQGAYHWHFLPRPASLKSRPVSSEPDWRSIWGTRFMLELSANTAEFLQLIQLYQIRPQTKTLDSSTVTVICIICKIRGTKVSSMKIFTITAIQRSKRIKKNKAYEQHQLEPDHHKKMAIELCRVKPWWLSSHGFL